MGDAKCAEDYRYLPGAIVHAVCPPCDKGCRAELDEGLEMDAPLLLECPWCRQMTAEVVEVVAEGRL